MPSWWRKSSSKEVKKKRSRDIFDGFRKFKFLSDEKTSFKSSGGSRRDRLDTASENGSGLRVDSRSRSPSNPVSRCQTFAESPHGKPFPLPSAVPSILGRTESPKLSKKNSGKDILRPGSPLSRHNNHSTSPKKLLSNNRDVPVCLQIPVNGILASALGSSMSSPSRSPMRAYVSEQSQSNAFWATKLYPETALFGSGHCSSPGSG